ncbi:hypothetical protein J7T55_005443 [Diaporthe amygdali]|uniref:uncharacterized protein n=1 Tax=Phomopsis amygdali TaxID=1214568 RepID=UPI0022FDC3E1|nr:uncharacterized protein J7T55_005443 [Diaporthe amygdali]KAJ0108900.1 hypothetical protein J7T55_005443 [Diaporthe amygdali]
MDDADGSTTPPLPPSESSEAYSPQKPSQSPPFSAQLDRQQEEQEPGSEQGENGGKDARKDASPHHSRLPRPANSRTPEPRIVTLSNPHTHSKHRSQANGHGHLAGLTHAAHLAPERSATPDTPGTVGSIASFDWEDLEARFEAALADANQHEQALMAEFEALVRYFNVWASAASAHDNERATKRLQTRTQYVQLREADLEKKKMYYQQVMQAFQSAMHLLSQS